MAPLMEKFTAQHAKAHQGTESKISADIALIREKHTFIPAMKEDS